MGRKIITGILALIVLALLLAGIGLAWAHVSIRRERAPLPDAPVILAAAPTADRPIRLWFINTASQPMPRSAVLDRARDPRPRSPYVMSHPSFVLEWSDGRILLIDLGMTRAGATAFGRPLETLGGAAPIDPHFSVAERLGDASNRVQAVIFTHLHVDHVGGIEDLCAAVNHPVRVFMTDAQEGRPNYTTRSGLSLLREARCVRRERLEGGPLLSVPGFPGVEVIAAGGHTPGSQIVVAHLQSNGGVRPYVFTGDIVNNIDGINHDIPKPYLYSLLLVPEAPERLSELRQFLRRLRDDHGLPLLVSHDQLQIEQSHIPAW